MSEPQTNDALNPKLDQSSDSPQNDLPKLFAETKPWVRVISMLFLIASGFALFHTINLAYLGLWSRQPSVILLSAVSFASSFLYIFPCYWLWSYANQITVYLHNPSDQTLTNAIRSQKSFWKFVGISVIVCILAYFVLGFALQAYLTNWMNGHFVGR